MCAVVSRWSITHDKALARVFGCLEKTIDKSLYGALSPEDLDDIQLVLWTDADWNGDPEHTKSTNGLYLELESPSSGRTWPLTWGSKKQTSTSLSTCEAETVSAVSAMKAEVYPIQEMIEQALGKRVPVVVRIDNTQAITAIQRGYSKKLRHLKRCHRIAIGWAHERVNDADGKTSVEYHETSTHKGTIFTKALERKPFERERELIGMR